MANPWFRVWGDMANDPKWRTIARVSQQRIGDVIAVYLHMLTSASNASERGRTEGWNSEDIATALDIDTEQVEAICNAMQGRVRDGDHLTGWEKRQPNREDGADERGKLFRARQKIDQLALALQTQAQAQTQKNADERDQTPDKTREDKMIKTVKAIKAKTKATTAATKVETTTATATAKTATPSAAKFSAFGFLTERGVEVQIAKDWLEVRKLKRLASTLTAFENLVAEVDKSGLSLQDAVSYCCKQSWGGFKATWPRDGTQPNEEDARFKGAK